jgi:hypothetical protein
MSSWRVSLCWMPWRLVCPSYWSKNAAYLYFYSISQRYKNVLNDSLIIKLLALPINWVYLAIWCQYHQGIVMIQYWWFCASLVSSLYWFWRSLEKHWCLIQCLKWMLVFNSFVSQRIKVIRYSHPNPIKIFTSVIWRVV